MPFLPFTATALATDDVGKGEDAAPTPAQCAWATPGVVTPEIEIVVVSPAVSVTLECTLFLAPVGT